MSRKQFGLLGKNIAYSFSKKYFTEKFASEHIEATFENFDIQSINDFPKIIQNNQDLKGFSVTIPYKETIIPYLDKLSKTAKKIGAVNAVRFTPKGKLKGYNSDYFGFMKSIKPLLKPQHQNALILGTGGAAKAIAFGLKKLGITYTFVSRKPTKNTLNYHQIDADTFEKFQIIINCTPLGTSPNTDAFPPIPFNFFTPNHIAFDLIYNPEETEFLIRAKTNGAITKNGFEMLVLQAEKAWEIWNK